MIMTAGLMIMTAAAKASEVTTVAFNETRVNVPATVRFVQGDSYGFSVEAKDSIIARSVRCTVKDSVLTINMGNALQPGEQKFDAKKGVYYYGVNTANQVLADKESDAEMVITVIAPELPKLAVSSDYEAVSVK